jgi:hypothetical protein
MQPLGMSALKEGADVIGWRPDAARGDRAQTSQPEHLGGGGGGGEIKNKGTMKPRLAIRAEQP